MLNLFNDSYTEVDSKINELSVKIERVQPIFSTPSQSDWNDLFKLCENINENFKHVRYPTKMERDNAWQRFFNLRDKAYKVRHKQIEDRSEKHYDELMRQLKGLDYDKLADKLVGEIMTFGLGKATAEEMKRKGKHLGDSGAYFKSVKNEMNREHKTKVFERILDIRKSHDEFWSEYKSHQAEKAKIYEEKQRAWKEKQERSREIKEKIESNISSNESKRDNAREALSRFERKRDELQEKIYDSHSDDWKEKAEGWLDEFNEKIQSIEEQIERYDKWIEEDKEKLRNWH